MKNIIKRFFVIASILLFVNFSITTGVSAQSVNSTNELQINNLTAEKIEALGFSVYFTNDGLMNIDKERALVYYDFSQQELDSIESQLKNISKDRVAELKEITMSIQNNDEPVVYAIPVIVWVGAGIIGVLTGAAIYFTGKYMNWQEKKYLVDTCYKHGGRPILDSGDTAGLNGEPKKAWWKIGNTYSFECAK
ncbi:hypothetical protein FJQ98_08645 [Lysinibacillus agricola]|uniref:Uncharacterized protein n=1 Tax=Lysinibacillus agricola TaxID=2590012 RepID=A0ABX7AXR6_9BACI|nr:MULTISPECIES: hypothetical protein [Lysinibacillus]KOS63598.1 hypothetical protein AN161_06430 [Lysinibacillus sp. FJAT-14222]QQP14072.1 hypothetical protein FJQ98_08645 [Lysinibacillus agricola]